MNVHNYRMTKYNILYLCNMQLTASLVPSFSMLHAENGRPVTLKSWEWPGDEAS